jgi:hypothetical protein
MTNIFRTVSQWYTIYSNTFGAAVKEQSITSIKEPLICVLNSNNNFEFLKRSAKEPSDNTILLIIKYGKHCCSIITVYTNTIHLGIIM